MHDGQVESTRYPRNPLDVLAQQIVAMAGLETWEVDPLAAVRRARLADLSRHIFDGVLDMLSGDIRPTNSPSCAASPGTASTARSLVVKGDAVAIANAGTIPPRAMRRLSRADRPVRVGELDEEMVFETQVGETFLGASTWRIERSADQAARRTRRTWKDAVLARRPGRAAGGTRLRSARLVRELRTVPGRGARAARPASRPRPGSAESLLRYLDDQLAVGAIPDDIVIERCLDDLGDWRVCLLSPLGSAFTHRGPWP